MMQLAFEAELSSDQNSYLQILHIYCVILPLCPTGINKITQENQCKCILGILNLHEGLVACLQPGLLPVQISHSSNINKQVYVVSESAGSA